jgi:hypothetical protein
MQASILKGLYGLPSTPQHNCAANCAWRGSFASLGFDFACKNVTKPTLATKKCSNTFNGTKTPDTLCNMTTPGNVFLPTVMQAPVFMTSVSVGTKFQFISASSANANTSSISPEILRIAVLQAATDDPTFEKPSREEIVECNLSLAAYRFSNITAAGSNFTISATDKVALRNGIATVDIDPAVNQPAVNQSTVADFTVQDYRPWYYTFQPQADNYPNLTISEADFAAIIDFFASSLVVGKLLYGGLAIGGEAGVRIPFSYPSNLTKIFQNVESAMTEYVLSGPGSTFVGGERIDSVIYVRVQWYWLSLPCFVMVLALGVVSWAIVGSKRADGVELWKDSPLALLFASFTSDGVLRPMDLASIREMSTESHAHVE